MEDALRWDNPIRYVTSDDIRGITKGMTYGAIVTRLGPTRDVGSGLHVALYVALYIVDRAKSLYLSFAGLEQVCSRDGAELLQSLEATDFSMIGITGVVKNIVQGKDGITMLVEAKQVSDTTVSAASVTVTMQSRVIRDQTPIEGPFGYTKIEVGDTVEVSFTGPVTMSFPVMGVAAVVTVMSTP
jgi:hypothetical protein